MLQEFFAIVEHVERYATLAQSTVFGAQGFRQAVEWLQLASKKRYATRAQRHSKLSEQSEKMKLDHLNRQTYVFIPVSR